MKFPSLKNLLEEAITTFSRFTASLLFAVLGTVCTIYLIQTESENETIIRLIMACGYGLLLSISAVIYAESTNRNKWAWQLIAVALTLLLFYFINPIRNEIDVMRYFVLSVALHLLVSFAAFINKGQINGFWQFNKTLFIRILVSGLYSGVLFLGIAAALGTTQVLFDLRIDAKVYFQLWVFLVGIFNTTFFLSGVPNNWNELDSDTTYPKGLKTFTQFVLIPLVSIYLIILIAYEFKILIEWELPQGIVSSLIIPFAIFGILSILLVFPLRNSEENKWINTFSKWFYIAIIPLIIMLFIAVGKRITDYGITESRYYLLLLTLWLTFITLYFIFKSKEQIKIIPISLFFAALISLYGPQSASSVSNWSQVNRFEKIATNAGALTEDKIQSNFNWKAEDGKQIASIVKYFFNKNQLNNLNKFTEVDLNTINTHTKSDDFKTDSNYFEKQQMNRDSALSVFGVNKSIYLFNYNVDDFMEINNASTHYTIKNSDKKIDIAGFNSLIEVAKSLSDNQFSNDEITIELSNDKILTILANNSNFAFDLSNLFDYLNSNYESLIKTNLVELTIPTNYFTVNATNNSRLIIKQVNIYYDKYNKKFDIKYLEAIILIK